ncbi:energy-coupling factor ABC transporter ATP-binding protein [Brachybacterium avium]|uniref:Energy-coupling factor ABC transporter ATP-binding protein n=1 Tax=Brachybacterium avium TaxID=2017485 RepID=A0A220UAY1_9MICO|nr:ATP-binding cassette domain-containing protein [Brachybacterium avium]ASK65132.1 energy-coupling factor ABC transporter ATP-binding protein [Brachybacterium avium]
MSAEAGTVRDDTSRPVGAAASTEPTAPAELVVEARDLEVVLPSGAGVGPWTGTLRAGEQVLLLGPSGCGKSTLLRALAGAIPAHQRGRVTGTLRVGEIDPIAGGVLAASAAVGFLGQDPADGVCLPQVADDVALPLESRCVPPAQIGQRVHRALAEAGIDDLSERAAATLSGGQLQRAGLAAAVVGRPRLLLLDEPTAMLDADGVQAVREAVTAAAAGGEVAVLLVEHRLDDWAGERGVAGLPPRTIALDASGRVLADGPTGEVFARHGATLREAGCWLPRELEQQLEGAAELSPERCAGPVRDLAPDSPANAAADPAREPLLTVRGAELGHQGRPVLSGVDLTVRSGQLLAVVGRNGAGKSTLLGALSRLDPPLRGEVEGAAAGLVFQRPEAQFVADTVTGELAASGVDPAQVTAMLTRLGLEEQREASPFALSGGQQRRLSLGAMLLTERPVLLADEPGYGLDRAAAHTVLNQLREAADAGQGVVIATHDLRTVEAADAVAVIDDGRLNGPMPPADLLQDTALLQRAGLVAGEPVADACPLAGAEPQPAAEKPPSAVEPDPRAGPRGRLARRNPTVLLALLTGLSIVCIALTDPVPLLVLYALLGAGVMIGCRRGPLALLRGQLPFVVFASGIFLVNVVSRPGHEPWPELPIRITEEGIVLGAALALRALVIGLGALTVMWATEPRNTMVSLQQHARLPARFTYALLAGRRLLDDLPHRWETLTRAHRVRLPLTAAGAVARLRPRHLLRCAFGLLVDAVRSAERIAFALESRGLGEGERTLWRPVPLGRGDALLACGIAAVVIAVLVLV